MTACGGKEKDKKVIHIQIAYENNTVNITPVTIEDEVNKVVVGFK